MSPIDIDLLGGPAPCAPAPLPKPPPPPLFDDGTGGGPDDVPKISSIDGSDPRCADAPCPGSGTEPADCPGNGTAPADWPGNGTAPAFWPGNGTAPPWPGN